MMKNRLNIDVIAVDLYLSGLAVVLAFACGAPWALIPLVVGFLYSSIVVWVHDDDD